MSPEARTAATDLRPSATTYAGLFVVTLTMLAYEIALTRIFSVTMWYHFAFVAISLALFGMTAGALIVHFRPAWFTADKVKAQMFRFSLLYVGSMLLALVGQLAVPFRPELNAVGIFSVLYTCALIAIPFTLVGVVVCLALTKFPEKVNRLYAADLVGAGFGCILLVAGFAFFDGLSLVIFVAAVAAVGSLLLAVDAGTARGALVSVTAVVLLVAVAIGNNASPFVKIIYGKEGQTADAPVFDEWNAFSRVTVHGDGASESGPAVPGGLSPAADERNFTSRQMGLLIDGTAGTPIFGYDGDPATTEFLRYDVSNLHYHAFDGEEFSAAVVGVGGGKDVLSALQFGADEVVGIEINGNILDLVNEELGDFSGRVDEDERVSYVVDEARSWLTRADQSFDSIQISLIDSWAATAAGAFALTENTLYTVEGWDTFLDTLEPGGVLSATRFFQHQTEEPLEIIRTAVLAAEVLDQRGVENPRDHVLIYEGPAGAFGETLGTVMVSPDPFEGPALARIEEAAAEMEYTPVLTPTETSDERLAVVLEPGGPGPALGQFSADVSAPTDDRPFFFQMASFRDVATLEGFGEDSHIFKGVYTLLFLGMGVLGLAAVCIGGPLIHMSRRTSHRGHWPHYLYFSGIGLGFLLVEISQLMRLATFLGHPTYALTVVLFTVLVFSGAGSMVVEKLIDLSRPRALLRPLVALLGVVLVFGLVTPSVIDIYAGATTPVRILVSVAILAPLSFMMGMPFAIGMRVAAHHGAPTAFLWGINGATSVVASVFAMVIAVFFGIAMTLFAGFAAYLLAAGSLAASVRRMSPSPVPAEASGAPDAASQPDRATVAGATT
ncbi:hypothetical protein BH23ACT2_BH23ACT2_00070 [soil metagenome]